MISITKSASVHFPRFLFGHTIQSGSDEPPHGGLRALPINGHAHENRGFARFVEFCPADVKQQAESCPFHRHLILGCKDTIPSVLCQEVKK